MLSILITPGKIASLGTSDLSFLRNLASSGKGTAQYQAQNILCFFYGECDYYSFYPEDGNRSALVGVNKIDEATEQSELNVYPNPAANWVMIELSNDAYESLENAQVVIMDISGKELFQTNLSRTTYLWETGNIENGIYLIIIKSNNGIYATEKVVVNR